MKKISLFNYIKNKLLNIILLFSFTTFIILTILLFQFYQREEKYKTLLFDTIINHSVTNLLNKTQILEQNYNKILCDFLTEFSKNYSSYKNDEYINKKLNKVIPVLINFSKKIGFKLSKNDINYYFINKDGTIFKSDYKKDIGLNLSIFKNLWNELKKLKPNTLYISPIDRESATGIPRFFAYIKLKDNNIFEIGIKLTNFLKIIENEIYTNAYKKFKIKNIYIQGNIQNISNLKNNTNISIKLNNKDKEILKKSFKLNKVISRRKSLTIKVYYYSFKTKLGTKNIIVEIYSKEFLHTIIAILITLFSIILSILTIFIVGKSITNNISNKIYQLASLFDKFNIEKPNTFKYIDFPKTSIIEIDKIYENFCNLTKKIINNQKKLIKEKEIINNLLLKASENMELFTKVSNTVPAAIIILKDNKIFFNNDYVKTLFKVDKNYFKTNKDIYAFLTNSTKHLIDNIINKDFNKQIINEELIIRIFSFDKTTKWTKLIIQNIKIQNENALLFIFLDIDDIKKKEIELIKSIRDLDKYQKDTIKIIDIINKMVTSKNQSTIQFLIYIFKELYSLIEEADYGSIYFNTGTYIRFLDSIGYDTKILKNLKIKTEWFKYAKDEIAIFNDIQEHDRKCIKDKKVRKALINASKKIKSALQITIQTEIGGHITISLDIDYKSKKDFSEKSINIAKLFKKLLDIHFSSKLNADRLKIILYSIADGVIVTDVNRKIILTNHKIKEFLGIYKEKITGKPLKDIFNNFDIISFKQKSYYTYDKFSQNIEQTLNDFFSDTPGVYELQIKLLNESVKILEISKNRYFNDYDEFLGEIITIRDITKEIELNKQLIQSQKLETIGKFTGGIAHDFNNILGSILGSSELIKLGLNKNKITKNDINELLEYVELIAESAYKGKKFIRNLLNFTGTATESIEKIDIHQTIKNVVEIAKKSINKKNKIKLSLKAEYFITTGNQISLENALLNIILNADQAIQNKNGLIKITTENIYNNRNNNTHTNNINNKNNIKNTNNINNININNVNNINNVIDINKIENINKINNTDNKEDFVNNDINNHIDSINNTKIKTINKEQFINNTFNDFIKITITDNGIGIKQEILNRIFEPFFTTKDKGKGTGLGLSMVYQTIKSHKGFIRVNSKSGAGTSFYIYLPVLKEIISKKNIKNISNNKKNNLKNNIKNNVENNIKSDIEEKDNFLYSSLNQENKSSLPKITDRKINILLVDDEESIRKVLKLNLEKYGFNVILAQNGKEAIEKFKSNKKFDLVILDLLMPEMDGKETFYNLKKIDSDVKVIISSGYNDTIDIQDLYNNGVNDVLFKPYKTEEIIEVIENLINKI